MRRTGSTLILALILATVAAAIPSLARAAPTATTTPIPGAHLPHFDLLSKPTTFAEIPRIYRFPFEQELPKGARHGFWKGKVRLSEGTVTAFGNRRMICFEHRLREFGAGSCDRTRRVLHKGLSVSSFCVEGGEDVRISGLVPNGVTALGVDRHADGQIEETIPVTNNAFTVVLEPAGVVLHGIGPGTRGLAIKVPLGRLHGANPPCGGTQEGGVTAHESSPTVPILRAHRHADLAKPGQIDDLLAPTRGEGGCGPVAARRTFSDFLAAFDHGNTKKLDSLFAKEPAFKWFSAVAPGPPRFNRAAKRRDTLVPYFRTLHRRHLRLRLAWLQVNGSPRHHSTGLAFGLRGSARGFRDGRWFRVEGKANLFCHVGEAKFRVVSLGYPKPAAG